MSFATRPNVTIPVAIKRVQTTESECRTYSADSTDSAQAIASIQLSGPEQNGAGKHPVNEQHSAKASIAQKLSSYLLPLFASKEPPPDAMANQNSAYIVRDMPGKQQQLLPSKQQPGAANVFAASSLADRMSMDAVSLSHGATQSTSSNFSVMSAQSLGQAFSPSTSNDSETTATVVYPGQQAAPKQAQPSNMRPRAGTQMLSLATTVPPRMQRSHWSLEDYTVLEKLYTGYASTVYKAVCRRSAETVVLKVYHLTSVCELYRWAPLRAGPAPAPPRPRPGPAPPAPGGGSRGAPGACCNTQPLAASCELPVQAGQGEGKGREGANAAPAGSAGPAPADGAAAAAPAAAAAAGSRSTARCGCTPACSTRTWCICMPPSRRATRWSWCW
jgi:hypothetical protein